MYAGSGLFVVLEGSDGSGKTTVASMLVEKLSKLGYSVAYTYEPTDSEVVTLMKTKYRDLRDPYIDALTFALDRLLHVKITIKPLLEKGYVVVSDRYFYSSAAYQSACGAPLEWVLEVNAWALKPDIAVYLDVEPELALKRKLGSSSRFPEFEEVLLLRRVREAYLELVKRGLLIKVDASRSVEEVYSDVEGAVLGALRSRATSW
ncbi:MAG: dTMP kinase [Desulfurococcaceae archaeon]